MNPEIFSSDAAFKEAWINEFVDRTGIENTSMLGSIFDNTYSNEIITLDNTYHAKEYDRPALNVLAEIANKEYVISETGTLFMQHATKLAPIVATQKELGEERKVFKKIFLDAREAGNQILANRQNIAQLSVKLAMNTFYGIANNVYARYFNSDVSNSVTIRGRSTISVCALGVEFMRGSLKMTDIDSLLYTIQQTLNTVYSVEANEILLDMEDVSADQVLEQLVGGDYKEKSYYSFVHMKLTCKTTHELKKLYLKGNIYKAMETPKLIGLLREITSAMNSRNEPLLDIHTVGNPAKAPSYDTLIRKYVDIVDELVSGFVWYGGYNNEDTIRETMKHLKRLLIVLIDTDSNMIYLQDGMNFIFDKLGNKIMPNLSIDDRLFSVANIINLIYFNATTKLLTRYCEYSCIPFDYATFISMKSEFLFDRMLLTRAKKNYLARIRVVEGRVLPSPDMEVKGLTFKKSQFNKNIRDGIHHIAEELIMDPEIPDTKAILQAIVKLEDSVRAKMMTAEGAKEMFDTAKLKDSLETADITYYRYRTVQLWNYMVDFKDRIVPPAAYYHAKLNLEGRKEELEKKYPEVFESMTKYHIQDVHNVYAHRAEFKLLGDTYAPPLAELFDNEDEYNMIRNYLLTHFSGMVKANVHEPSYKKALSLNKRKYRDDMLLGPQGLGLDKVKDAVRIKSLMKYVVTYHEPNIEKINAIAVPLGVTNLPPFIVDFGGIVDIDALISSVMTGMGVVTCRSDSKKLHVSNVVNFY